MGARYTADDFDNREGLAGLGNGKKPLWGWMVAPRPVFLSAGKGPDTNPDGTIMMMPTGDPRFQASRGPIEQQAANINDALVDAKGTFRAGVGAGPVYRLLGRKDLGTEEFPRRTHARSELARVSGVRRPLFRQVRSEAH